MYVYDKKEEECPSQFWLLSNMKELTQLDSDEKDFLLELAFDGEIVIFKFNSQKTLESWQAMLKKAKDFNASNYYTGETVTEIKEVILAHDTTTILTFNMDNKYQVTKQGIVLIENIKDIVMKELKPECSMVCIHYSGPGNLKPVHHCSMGISKNYVDHFSHYFDHLSTSS